MKNLNTDALYVGRITAADANYTYGSAKNETVPGAGDGSLYEKGRANDVLGLQQALLRLASIVPNGNADTQLICEQLEALVELASGRAINYDESGIVNAYEVDVRTGQQGPRSYFDGLRGEFTPGNDNTGASTINVHGLGVKNLFYNDASCVGGEIVTSLKYGFEYNLASDRCNLILLPGTILDVTGYTGTSKTYFHNDIANDTVFDIGTNIAAAWESIGPNGVGADNYWPALDDLPVNAVAITITIHQRLAGSTVSSQFYDSIVYGRKNGSARANNNSSILTQHSYQHVASALDDRIIKTEVDISVDSDGIFQLYHVLSGLGATDVVNMYLKKIHVV